MAAGIQTVGIKYIGSKAELIGPILALIDKQLGAPRTLKVIDVFTGTTRVAQAFRARGWQVQSSDLSWASEAYANAFLLRTATSGTRIPALIAALREQLEVATQTAGWITTNYCDVSGAEGGLVRMWKPKNGIRADWIRDAIQSWETLGEINRHEAMILVACLIFALDKVDNSVGVQQAYLKSWATRTDNDLDLVDLPFVTGRPAGKHTVGNCLEVSYEPADVAYLDPPHSSHSYATYYHIWDSITRWDKPAVGLKTNRRIDRVAKAEEFDTGMISAWNRRGEALKAFMAVCERLPVRNLIISYNDESLIPLDDLVKALKDKFGAVTVEKIPYTRNIMSQIGNAAIYNEEFKTKNHEVLLWVQKN